MAERLRFHISRVIPSFRSCRSKDAAAVSSAVESPVFHVSTVNFGASPLAEAAPYPGELRRSHVVPATPGCSYESEALAGGPPPAYLWRKEEKWHVVARVGSSSPRRKIDSDGDGRELFPPLSIRRGSRRMGPAGKKKKNPKLTRSRTRVSASSADSHWFSSEDEYLEDYDYGDEKELLKSSSRSFTTYSFSSPEVSPRLKPIRESPTHFHKLMKLPHGVGGQGLSRTKCPPLVGHSPPAGGRRSSSSVSSVLRKLMMTPLCGVTMEGKVKESFAVVKRSRDPYTDFRRSMLEMVVKNQMYEEGDLEELLRCFLLLNSHHHHRIIVRAFSDVWATLFPTSHSCTSAMGTPPPAALSSSG